MLKWGMENYAKKAVGSISKIVSYYDHNNLWHRLDGPAVHSQDFEGCFFYVHGEELAEKDYWKHPMVVAYNLDKLISEVLGE